MALTTASHVAQILGITLDSTNTPIIEGLIDAVSQEIEAYCQRTFSRSTFYEYITGSSQPWRTATGLPTADYEEANLVRPLVNPRRRDRVFVLPNAPTNAILYAGAGQSSVIKVEYTGAGVATVNLSGTNLILSKNLVATTIDLTSSTITDMASVVTAISNESGWTATIENSTYEDLSPRMLLPHTFSPLSNPETTYLLASLYQFNLLQENEFTFRTEYPINYDESVTIVYDGGYDSIPDALEQLAAEMTAQLYRTEGVDRTLVAEKIGNYSYRRGGSEMAELMRQQSTRLSIWMVPRL
jgi:hypothetical protein